MSPSAAKLYGVPSKNRLRPHCSDYWCIPSIADADFIAAMEDVLDVYECPMIHFVLLYVWLRSRISFLERREINGLCVREMIKRLIPNT